MSGSYLGQVRALRRTAQAGVEAFGLSGKLSFIHHGENTTWRLKGNDGEFLIRIHRPGYQTESTIRSELLWLRALEAAGIGAPIPTAMQDGDLLAKVGGPNQEERIITCTQWVKGRMMGRRVTDDMFRATGRTLAQLHEHAARFELPEGFERKVLDMEGLFGDEPVMGGSLELVPAELRDLFEETQDALRSRIALHGRTPSTFSLIHADLHYRNVVFQGSGAEVKALPIDFDDAAFGYLAYDLAVTLGPLERFYPGANSRELVLEGYRSERELMPEIEEMIDHFRVVRMMTITLWVLGRHDHPHFVKRAPTQLEDARRVFLEYKDKNLG